MTETKKEFVLRHAFKKFSELTRAYSPYETRFGVSWRIVLIHEKNDIGVFLDCNSRVKSNLWSVKTSVIFDFKTKNGETMFNQNRKRDLANFSQHSASKGILNLGDYNKIIENCVENDELTAEVRVEIKEMTGISQKRKINFDEPNPKMTDVCLVADGKKFHVKKFMLAQFSPVLEAMFFGEFVEADSKEVVIEDTDAQTFESFLSLIYVSDAEITAKNVENVMKLADRYDVKRVSDKCENFLMWNNDVKIEKKFELAEKYSFSRLQERCLNNLKSKKDIALVTQNNPEMGLLTTRALLNRSISF